MMHGSYELLSHELRFFSEHLKIIRFFDESPLCFILTFFDCVWVGYHVKISILDIEVEEEHAGIPRADLTTELRLG